jgi:acetyl esterase/lipase
MKKLIYFILLLFLGNFIFISCSSEDTTEESGIIITDPLAAETILNVSYGPNSQQVYDIYLPNGRSAENTKVIVLVHGGGWTGGDKSDMENFVSLIQQYHPDHAIVNINYVLASTNPPFIPAFPNQFLDLGTVIGQLILQKEELAILPEFGLIGTSAGAHISLMYDYVYDTHDVVKMVADIVGPTNFTDPFYAENPFFGLALNALVDESAYPFGTNYAEVTSPALQVSNTSSPSILFYGNQDPLVPLTNGVLLNDNLSNSSITHSFTVYDGGHGDWDDTSIINLQLQLTDFINSHLPIN